LVPEDVILYTVPDNPAIEDKPPDYKALFPKENSPPPCVTDVVEEPNTLTTESTPNPSLLSTNTENIALVVSVNGSQQQLAASNSALNANDSAASSSPKAQLKLVTQTSV
jgi:hypothetical protein